MALAKPTRSKLEAELAVLLKKGRLQRAAAVLRAILEQDPGDDRLFVKLAEVSLKLGDEEGVRAAFRGAAAAAERKGFYLRAMAALRQLARHQAPADRPWAELSGLAVRLGLVGDALGFLDEGIRAWEEAGDVPAVLQALRRTRELAPDDVQRALRLAHALRQAGQGEEAMALLAGEAGRHRAAGREDAWLALAAERAGLTPTDRALACEVASAHLARGEPRKALQRLQALLRERAQHPDSLRLLVRVFEALGQPARRLAALRDLARSLTSLGRDTAARPHWEALLDAEPADPEARRALGLGPLAVPPAAARVLARAAAPQAGAGATPAAPAPGGAPPRPAAAGALPPPPAAPAPVATAALVRPPAAWPPLPAAEPEEEIIDLAADGVEVAEPAPPPALAATPPPGSPLLLAVDVSLLAPEPEPAPAAPAALGAHADLDDDLAHLEFLVGNRFSEEARTLLASLEAAHPGHPGLAALRARLDAGPERIPAHPQAPAEPQPAGVEGAAPVDLDALGGVALVSAEEVLQQFREAVALHVPEGDAATHYDLGIAYREMGLTGEARASFELALASATGPRAVDCLVGVALCQAAQGERDQAARTLKRALAHQALTPVGAAAVLYELGALREAGGDAKGAAWAFRAAERSQPRFRDAAARAGRLHPAASPGDDAAGLGLLPSGA